MAMYDWNGTVVTDLGNAYDWDGTTAHDLGYGYDWDGTTGHLFYSAETEYFNGGAKVAYTTYNYYHNRKSYAVTLTVGTTIYSKLNNSIDQTIIRFTANLTNIKTLSFVFDSVSLQNNGTLLVGVSTYTDMGTPNAFIKSQWTKYTTVTSSGTKTVDVSSYSGTYQICISFSCSTGLGGNYTCSKIIGEE